MPRWLVILVVVSPAIALIGLGLLTDVTDDESWTALLPFVLTAVLAMVVLLAVYGARDRSLPLSSEPFWPKSRLGVWAYVAGILFFPATLLTVALVSIANRQWLVAIMFLAMTVTPVLIRGRHLLIARRRTHESR